jgi:hypothetical protein
VGKGEKDDAPHATVMAPSRVKGKDVLRDHRLVGKSPGGARGRRIRETRTSVR